MEDDSSKRGVVIKGCWKKVVEQKIDKEINVREDLKMIADMHKVILHQLIFTLKETGFDIESDEFIKESGFMGEVIRGTLMRDMGYSNPMSNFINQIVGIDIKDGERYANFNSDNLIKLLDKKDDKKIKQLYDWMKKQHKKIWGVVCYERYVQH